MAAELQSEIDYWLKIFGDLQLPAIKTHQYYKMYAAVALLDENFAKMEQAIAEAGWVDGGAMVAQHPHRCLLRPQHCQHWKKEKNQISDYLKPPLEPPAKSGVTSIQDEPNPLLENRLNSPKCFDDGHVEAKVF